MPILNLSDKVLSQTHNKTVFTSPGFMFKDLHGKPMFIPDVQVVKWTPKKEK